MVRRPSCQPAGWPVSGYCDGGAGGTASSDFEPPAGRGPGRQVVYRFPPGRAAA